MNITFAPVDQNFINAKVQEGYYSNATEMVRDAVRRLREREAEPNTYLMKSLAEGEADIAAGRYEEYTPALLARIEKDALAKSRKKKRS